MKLLVSGCSFSSGYGFPLELQDPNIWPNRVAKALDADLNNLSVPGYDNTGIFLNVLNDLTVNDYDLILIQFTSLNRIVVSPNMHGTTSPGVLNTLNNFKTKTEFDTFNKQWIRLNKDFEHWKRLISIITIFQKMIDQGYNIKFINGLLHWNKDFFDNDRSIFALDLLDYHNLPDSDIKKGLDILNRDKQKINPEHWINLHESFYDMQIDNASSTDNHPGVRSHEIYTDKILTVTNKGDYRGKSKLG